jgi:tetratricopeptide (TPR) repeat protein
LIDVLAQVARTETILGRPGSALRHAERALAIADDLGLPRPATSLGYRGAARIQLGDRGGLEDARQAIAIARATGQSTLVVSLQNYLALELADIEGPTVSLEVLRDGIAFAQARGLTASADWLEAVSTASLFDNGDFDEALDTAERVIERFPHEWSMARFFAQITRVLVLATRGQVADTGELERLETASRADGTPSTIVAGLAASALARVESGQSDRARALLAEVEATPDVRGTAGYVTLLPTMVRTALRARDGVLAERLVADVVARHPSGEHALVAANAALAEARLELVPAGRAYREAAKRWKRFGVLPEAGFALLGLGRCLVSLGRAFDGQSAMLEARAIFTHLKAAPALAETEALLRTAGQGPPQAGVGAMRA